MVSLADLRYCYFVNKDWLGRSSVMEGLYFEFPHTVTVPCLDEDPSRCLANAWDLGGACRKRERDDVHPLLGMRTELAASAPEPAHDPERHRRQAEAPGQGRLQGP